MGALLNIAGGAGLKILSSFINGWLANRREKQLFRNKMDEKLLDYQVQIIKATQKDIWVKASRSLIFSALVGTYCFCVVWSVITPDFHYDLIFPKSKSIFSFLFVRTAGADQTDPRRRHDGVEIHGVNRGNHRVLGSSLETQVDCR